MVSMMMMIFFCVKSFSKNLIQEWLSSIFSKHFTAFYILLKIKSKHKKETSLSSKRDASASNFPQKKSLKQLKESEKGLSITLNFRLLNESKNCIFSAVTIYIKNYSFFVCVQNLQIPFRVLMCACAIIKYTFK